LEVADDLVHVFDDTLDGLVLVQHPLDPEAPDGRAAERREEHAPHGVAQRVAKAPFEGLEPELRDVLVVLALRRFNELRTDEPAEIDCLTHESEILVLKVRRAAHRRAVRRRLRPAPPLTRGRPVEMSGIRPTSNTTRRPVAPAPQSESTGGSAAR